MSKHIPFKNSFVERSSIEFDHFHDDPVNSYISAAYYVDGRDLTDPELDELTAECGDLISESWLEHQISRADFLSE